MRGREAAVLWQGTEVARLLDLPWEGTDPTHWEHAARAKGRVVLAGKLGPENVAEAIAAVKAVGRRRGVVARVGPRNQGSRPRAGLRGGSNTDDRP